MMDRQSPPVSPSPSPRSNTGITYPPPYKIVVRTTTKRTCFEVCSWPCLIAFVVVVFAAAMAARLLPPEFSSYCLWSETMTRWQNSHILLLQLLQRCMTINQQTDANRVRNVSSSSSSTTTSWLLLSLVLVFIITVSLATWLIVFTPPPPHNTINEMEHVVSVYPLGIQLYSTTTSQQQRGTMKQHILHKHQTTPRFIPREDIIDVIVSEVILSYKVMSVLLFRTRRRPPPSHPSSTTPTPTTTTTTTPNTSSLSPSSLEDWTLEQRRSNVQLIPVFPLIANDDVLTYQQCLLLREQITRALQV